MAEDQTGRDALDADRPELAVALSVLEASGQWDGHWRLKRRDGTVLNTVRLVGGDGLDDAGCD